MGGYSCLRKTKIGTKFREVYGKLTIPSSYAGTCPGDFDDSQTDYNIVPEMVYGVYVSIGGFDAGIRVAGGGGWRPFIYGNKAACGCIDGSKIFSTSQVKAGTPLRMRVWIDTSGSTYYAKLNISKTGYNDTDLMSSPLSIALTDGFKKAFLAEGGAEINREVTLAANQGVAKTFETSGCYLNNAIWGDTGLVDKGSGKNIAWSDGSSKTWTGTGATKGTSGAKVLQLRKDYSSTYDTRRIKVIETTDGTSGAHETVSIDFRSTPKI